jgi:hypothetical protein
VYAAHTSSDVVSSRKPARLLTLHKKADDLGGKMARIQFKTFVVFEGEDSCPDCLSDRIVMLAGGIAQPPALGYQIAIVSAAPDAELYLGGEIRPCADHAKNYEELEAELESFNEADD